MEKATTFRRSKKKNELRITNHGAFYHQTGPGKGEVGRQTAYLAFCLQGLMGSVVVTGLRKR